MKVTITIDHGGHQEHYSRVSDDHLVTPLLCGAFAAAFGAHKAEAEAIFGVVKELAKVIHSMDVGVISE